MTAAVLEPARWTGLPGDGQDAAALRLGAGWRSRTDTRTLRLLWPRLRRLGVTRVADVTELDRLGIPVVSAIRPGVDQAQITLAQGKGPTLVAATVSALMEAAERHCAAIVRPTVRACARDLLAQGCRVVGPADLGAASWRPEAVVEWVRATALDTAQTAWVPAAEVHFPYFAPEGVSRPVRPSTSGLAAGNTLTEAILHALLEVAERHAVSRLHQGGDARLVDLDRVEDTQARALVARFRAAQVDLFALDLSEGSVVPAYLVLTLDQNWIVPPKIIGGQGAHVDPGIALRRALYEAAQSRVVALQGSREDLRRHAHRWTPSFDDTRSRFELLRRHGAACGVADARPCATPPATMGGMARELLDHLARAGFGAGVWTDLSDPGLGVAVVHVCVPGQADLVVRSAGSPHAA